MDAVVVGVWRTAWRPVGLGGDKVGKKHLPWKVGVGFAGQVADPAELVLDEVALDGLGLGGVGVEVRGGDVVQECEALDGSHAAVVKDFQAL